MRFQLRYLVVGILFVTAVGLVALWQWFTVNYEYFSKRNISYVSFSDAGGHTFAAFTLNLYETFPNEKVSGYFLLRQPIYIIRDPEVWHQLNTEAFKHFEDHIVYIDFGMDELVNNSYFFMKGEVWKDFRENVSPVFAHNNLPILFDIISEIAQNLVEYLKTEHLQNKRLNYELKQLYSHSTNDAVLNVLFNIKNDAAMIKDKSIHTIAEAVEELTQPTAYLRMILVFLFPRPMKAFGYTFLNKEAMDFFKSLILGAMDERDKSNTQRLDIINYMHQIRRKHISRTSPKIWSDVELVGQCLSLFAIGYQALIIVLTFATYEIAIHPDVQHRLYNEIKLVEQSLNGTPITYTELKSLEYMDQVVSETLRKWPPVILNDRVCTKEYTLDLDGRPIRFEEGVGVFYPNIAVQNDAKYFPNPHVFDPSRFSTVNISNIRPGVYMPFGIGPRSCFAKHFSIMEVKTFLYHLLLSFNIVPNEQTKDQLHMDPSYVGLIPSEGIYVDFKIRI